MMGAGFLNVPELALAPDEAKTMAEAAQQVAAYYNAVLNPKALAWCNLLMVAGGIYGTRLVVIRKRWKDEAAAKPRNVIHEVPKTSNAGPGPAPGSSLRTPADMYGPDYSANLAGD